MPTHSRPLPETFVPDVLIPMLRNDLETVIEARCATHGRPGSSATFTACLLCCITGETFASLTAPQTATGDVAKRRQFYTRLGTFVGDPRYAELGEIVHLGFRHGIAHAFFPKGTADVLCGAVWLNGPTNVDSVCVGTLTGDALMRARSEHHLIFQDGLLTVVPQVFYRDLLDWMTDFEQRIRTGDADTTADLQRNFVDWWDENEHFRHISQDVRAVLDGTTHVPALMVRDYFTVSDAARTVRAWLEREPGPWVVVEEERGQPMRTRFDSEPEATDYASQRERALGREGLYSGRGVAC